jgi:hypothetical protein
VFSAQAFDVIAPESEAVFDLATLQAELLRRNSLAGHQVFERFYEIGSHVGLVETDTYLLDAKHRD